MIVRRDIARTCRFDENLAAGLHEDLDASYRFAQHGALVDLELPLIYHDQAPRPAEQARKGVHPALFMDRRACLSRAAILRP